MSTFDRATDSLYEVLEVRPNATLEEIEQAYGRIMSYLAPDSMAMYSMADEDDIVEQRSRVEEAYRVLSDPDRRAAYDAATSDPRPSYPVVLVPEPKSDASLTMGHVSIPAPATEHQTRPPVASSGADQTLVERSTPVATLEPPAPPEAPVHAPLPAPEPEPAPPSVLPVGAREKPRRPARRLHPTADVSELEAETEIGGGIFKRLRESAGASLNDVADITKVSKRYLRAIEENDFDILPAPVYVRGFVYEYAKVMGLDAEKVAKSFLALYKRYRGETS